jgi:tetratricopeptide (TPR) repeat protein
MKGNSKQLIFSVFLICAGFIGVFLISSFLEKNRVQLPEGYEDQDLALQGKRLKGYALGAEGLLADWYWMQSLQYLGDKVVRTGLENLNLDDLTALNPRLLYPLLDNAAGLDPNFIAPYSFGATILPAVDPAKAIQLTEKGIENNPEEWRLYQYLGYIHWRLKDYEKASEVYEKGSQIAGAPPFFKLMTAAMKRDAGSRGTAREIYAQMLTEAQDEQTKAAAEFRLTELDSLDERDAINSALDQQKQRSGRCPGSLSEIIPMLRSVKLPQGRDFHVNNSSQLTDPSGIAYILDSQTCKAVINPLSKIPRS